MSQRLSSDEQKVVGFVIFVLLVVGAAVIISRQLFPIFLSGSFLFFGLLIIVGLIEFFYREHSFLNFWDYFSTYIGITLLLFILGVGVTWFVGYGIGGTSLGQASVDFYNDFTKVEDDIEIAIEQIVEESCKTLPEESCDALRISVKSAKTLKDVKNIAKKLHKTSNIAKEIT